MMSKSEPMLERQPKGFSLLVVSELWESFGFYTLQTIIILYMSTRLGLSSEASYLLYGAFGSLLYLTPVLGGYVADRFMGFKRCIYLGGFLLVLGYVLAAFSSLPLFLLALSIIVVGNGLFKPNMPSLLGDLYNKKDPRREGGFTLFYMGINVGAILPTLFVDHLVESFGWHMGFLLAAAGVFLGMLIFILGRSSLQQAGEINAQHRLFKKGKRKQLFMAVLFFVLLASIAFVHYLLKVPNETDSVLVVASILIMALVIFFLIRQKKPERGKMLAALILIIVSVGFWAVYNQTYYSLMLFAETSMAKSFLGFTISADTTQYFNPFFIILLSPILSRLWMVLSERKINPSTPMKFTLGALFMALGFFFLSFGVRYFGDGGSSSPWWLVGSYFLQTVGELLLTPVGLAMITELSPPNLVGMMMGVWFLTQSAAYAISGGLAIWAEVSTQTEPQAMLSIYSHAFLLYGALSLLLAAISYMLIPYLKGLISGSSKDV